MSPKAWKRIAWNGIALPVPAAWRPARVGLRDLLFAAASGAALEVTWGPVRGRFSHRRQLERLGRALRREAAVTSAPLPERWAAALGGFEATGFRWRSAEASAEGAVLFCPVCRHAALIQFYAGAADGMTAAEVLAGLRDHREDGRREFALFDVRALVPGRLALCGQRFEAGRFRIEFEADGGRLSLWRWAPAAALLRGRTLAQFALGQPGFGGLPFRSGADSEPTVVEAREGEEGAGGWLGGRLRRRLSGRRPRRARVWVVAAANRILGVRGEGGRLPALPEWDEICTAYEVESSDPLAPGPDTGSGPGVRSGEEPGGDRDPPGRG